MSNQPVFRIKFRDPETRRTFDVGVVWPGKFEDSLNVQPQAEEDFNAKYPKMSLARAADLAIKGKGFLSLQVPKQRSPESRSGGSYDRPTGSTFDYGQSSDDTGIPF